MANRKEPLDEVLKDLASNDIKRRLRAIDSLVARGGKQAERELVRLLGDPSWHLRSYAAKVLGGFGKYMISSILNEAKQGVWYVRSSACMTLGYIGEIECLDPLLSFLEDESARVRIAAEEALLAIISKDRLKFVESYLSRKDADFQEFILEKLKKIDSDLYKDIVDESA
jgi:HEAT repeat protein